MKKSISFVSYLFMSLFTCASFLPYVTYAEAAKDVPSPLAVEGVQIKNVTALHRYPWNGLVDIYFETVCSDPTQAITVEVSATTKDWGRELTVESLQGGLTAPAGKHHLIWNAGIDAPSIRSERLSITVSEVTTSQYLVIDLSGGVDATSYPVNTLFAVPEGGWTIDHKTNKLVLRRIDAGTFMMGSPVGEWEYRRGEDLHQVTLTKPYYMGVFEVTQKQWSLVMGNNPSDYKGDARPVEEVSYKDIRGTIEEVTWPAFAEVDTTSFMGKLRMKTSLDFDLPTEAQWEYACRAGTTTAFNSGKNLTQEGWDTGTCSNVAEVGRYWWNGGETSRHATVGSYVANNWGLYDMHGNVSEWCLDRRNNGTEHVVNPVGSSGIFKPGGRGMRGGSWFANAEDCRSASQRKRLSNRRDDLGLRLTVPVVGRQAVAHSSSTNTASIMMEIFNTTSYPDWITPSYEGKYIAWAQGRNRVRVDSSTLQKAFLLNVAPSDDLSLQVISFVVNANGTISLTLNKEGMNGQLYLNATQDLNTWPARIPTSIQNGKITPPADTNFFKLEVDF